MIAGVFVGGLSRRMGGCPKGLLLAPANPEGERTTVIARTVTLLRRHCEEVVLVGRAEAYSALGIPALADDPKAPGEGPLSGLAALLDHARGGEVLAIACDMPYVTPAMIERLSSYAPHAPAVAPRPEGVWSPLFARYDSARVASVAHAKLASGVRALHAVLDACGALPLPLAAEEQAALRDWDSPTDIDDLQGGA